jgi:hypothetical protein
MVDELGDQSIAEPAIEVGRRAQIARGVLKRFSVGSGSTETMYEIC